VHGLALPQILNRAFSNEIADGELDFIEGRYVRIQVSDAKLEFCLTLQHGRIAMADTRQPVDLSISGSLYDYLLLISGREDPDTLFFQRHLSMEGDTHLGVYLKNVLAAVDLDSLPLLGGLQPVMQRCLNIYERLA
jgi:predicted lipid carrier protein YhbT